MENNTQTHSKQHMNTYTHVLAHTHKALKPPLQGLVGEKLYFSYRLLTHALLQTQVETHAPPPQLPCDQLRSKQEEGGTLEPSSFMLSVKTKRQKCHSQTTEPARHARCGALTHSSLMDLAL